MTDPNTRYNAHREYQPVHLKDSYQVCDGDPGAGKFADKWHVAGVTEVDSELTRADVTVTIPSDIGCLPGIKQMATLHEQGHVRVLDSIREAGGGARTLATYPRFQHEVEAWITQLRPGLRYSPATFVLDALNTYRRALGVKEGDWWFAREAVRAFVHVDEVGAYDAYLPLEPDPSDGLPPCSGLGDPANYSDGDGEPGDEGDHDTTPDGMDSRWNAPAVLKALERGKGIPPGLDPTKMTPIARAVWAKATTKG